MGDFPVGPHAPVIEQMTALLVTVLASKIVGLSTGSWIIMVNLLITQCVLEHAYSSIHIPIWHDFLFFATADAHQTHHTNSHANYGYTFDIFDGIFGTREESDTKKPSYLKNIGPATPCRIRFLKRTKLIQRFSSSSEQNRFRAEKK